MQFFTKNYTKTGHFFTFFSIFPLFVHFFVFLLSKSETFFAFFCHFFPAFNSPLLRRKIVPNAQVSNRKTKFFSKFSYCFKHNLLSRFHPSRLGQFSHQTRKFIQLWGASFLKLPIDWRIFLCSTNHKSRSTNHKPRSPLYVCKELSTNRPFYAKQTQFSK